MTRRAAGAWRPRVRGAMMVLVALSPVLVCPAASAQAAGDTALQGLTGVARARALSALVFEHRNQNAARALEHGREALEILDRDPEPRVRVDVLAEMAWAEMVLGNYTESVRVAESARDEARAARYTRGEARALNNLGVIARRRGDPAAAVDLFTESLTLRRRLGDPADVAMALNNLGFVYSTDLGNFDASLAHHLEAMRIRETLDRPADLALSLNNIGVLFQAMGELDRAQQYLERALELRRQHDVPLRVAGTLSNLGEVLLARGNARTALDHFRTALEIREEAGERSSVGASRLLIGQALTALRRFDEAERSLRVALATATELGETRSLVRVHQRLGELDSARGRYGAAEGHLLESVRLAGSMGARHLLVELYATLADVREAGGDYRGALDAHRRFKAAADAVLDESRAQSIATLDALYQAERREREIEGLRAEQAVRDLEVARQKQLRDMVILIAAMLVFGGLVFVQHRSSINRAVNQRLEVAARTDPLTGLDNRRAFMEKAELERARMRRSGRPAAVVLGDVDRFKSFNDRYGHAAGDRVLKHVAAQLTDVVRKLDVVARWGGEEFLLLLPETTLEGAVVLAEKLRSAIQAMPVEVDGERVPLTVTLGVAEAAADEPVDAWIAAADEAMYEGKEAGRNRVAVAAAGSTSALVPAGTRAAD